MSATRNSRWFSPYVTLMTGTAPQRDYPMRELLNALRYLVRYGIAWPAMRNDFPPWSAVSQQTQRWLAAGCFETLSQYLRALLRVALGRNEEPTAAIIDSRTLRSTPESGPRAGYDGAKRKRGSKAAVEYPLSFGKRAIAVALPGQGCSQHEQGDVQVAMALRRRSVRNAYQHRTSLLLHRSDERRL